MSPEAIAEAISIHTLRVEGDKEMSLRYKLVEISIHTLRVEGDPAGSDANVYNSDFNPHPPRGG